MSTVIFSRPNEPIVKHLVTNTCAIEVTRSPATNFKHMTISITDDENGFEREYELYLDTLYTTDKTNGLRLADTYAQQIALQLKSVKPEYKRNVLLSVKRYIDEIFTNEALIYSIPWYINEAKISDKEMVFKINPVHVAKLNIFFVQKALSLDKNSVMPIVHDTEITISDNLEIYTLNAMTPDNVIEFVAKANGPRDILDIDVLVDNKAVDRSFVVTANVYWLIHLINLLNDVKLICKQLNASSESNG